MSHHHLHGLHLQLLSEGVSKGFSEGQSGGEDSNFGGTPGRTGGRGGRLLGPAAAAGVTVPCGGGLLLEV